MGRRHAIAGQVDAPPDMFLVERVESIIISSETTHEVGNEGLPVHLWLRGSPYVLLDHASNVSGESRMGSHL